MELIEIKEFLIENSSPERKEKMAKIAPGAKHIYGVTNPIVNELAKELKNTSFEMVESLWSSGAFEERLLAEKVLFFIAKKNPERAINLVRKFSNDVDNWVHCDHLGMQSLKRINKTHSKEVFQLATSLSNSKMMWQRRLSLVLVEDFCKQKALHPAIQALVDRQKSDKEYYIKKAVVWLESALKKHATQK